MNCASRRGAATIALLICAALQPATAAALPARAAIDRAEQFLSLGDRAHAVEVLLAAMPEIQRAESPRTQAIAASLLGRAYLQLGQLEAAAPLLQRVVELAQTQPIPELAPSAFNDLGLLHVATHDDDIALDDFARGLAAATAAKQPEMAARIRINNADLHLQRGETLLAKALIDAALKDVAAMPPSPERVRLATAAASRVLPLAPGLPTPARRALMESTLRTAIADATGYADLRAQSEAYGEFGHLQERAQKWSAALDATRKALFAAQAAQAPELLYRWEWQAGRVTAGQGRPLEAIAFYARATATLQPIRHDLLQELRGRNAAYGEAIGALFLEYADLLLQQSSRESTPELSQQRLYAAREVIEQMKSAQLEDYFQDDCVAQFEARRRDIEQIESGTAVIYPIIFPDRLELLLSVRDRMQRFTVAVTARQLSDEALRFRKLLVRRDTTQYLESARQLHDWLIRPITEELRARQIDTLVLVPDGPLLGIPFSAMYDGQAFLVERYAIATAPGLQLIEPQGKQSVATRALLGGLSEAVQGFAALPSVQNELTEIGQLYSAQRLDNQQFTVPRVERAVDGNLFSVVHIASHGKFEADVRKSFLLTYDGRMGMDALERIVKAGRFRQEPVDLLTLSACETAAGDERAALGLAGVAIKAGARSVVATLWFIDDRASSELIGNFYRELGGGTLSKAKALQAAQKNLMKQAQYRHPGYWAPFLVIGNWR